ncbi:MAG: helix-turn-helix domain-containing protein [Planctomycetes bacterium]|nr:helix-turn-helix domain-containing protein [Planctomycetota bacterium]
MARSPAEPADIGPNVRRRRLAAGMTLEQLADASGVSTAMLSEVERSVKNPTVKLAYQIARALRCSLTDLLDDSDAQPVLVVRAAKRRTLNDRETGVVRHGLSPELLRRGIDLVLYELPRRSTTGELGANRAGILEHVVVLDGTLTLVLGGEATVLETGDGATYGPQTTTEYRNDKARPCRFLLVADATRAL